MTNQAHPDSTDLLALFNSLRAGQHVTISFTSCMGRTNTSGVEFKVGRRSHSKKWNVTTLFLESPDGSKTPTFAKYRLKLWHKDNRVSMAHGDMAITLHTIETA